MIDLYFCFSIYYLGFHLFEGNPVVSWAPLELFFIIFFRGHFTKWILNRTVNKKSKSLKLKTEREF